MTSVVCMAKAGDWGISEGTSEFFLSSQSFGFRACIVMGLSLLLLFPDAELQAAAAGQVAGFILPGF